MLVWPILPQFPGPAFDDDALALFIKTYGDRVSGLGLDLNAVPKRKQLNIQDCGPGTESAAPMTPR
jgi:hypothetical protein